LEVLKWALGIVLAARLFFRRRRGSDKLHVDWDLAERRGQSEG
jgi:hypothetical protein